MVGQNDSCLRACPFKRSNVDDGNFGERLQAWVLTMCGSAVVDWAEARLR